MIPSIKKVDYLFRKIDYFLTKKRDETDAYFVLLALRHTVELIDPRQKQTLQSFQERMEALDQKHIIPIAGEENREILMEQIRHKIKRIAAKAYEELEPEEEIENQLLNDQINLVVRRLKICC